MPTDRNLNGPSFFADADQWRWVKSFVTLEHNSEYVGVDVNDGETTSSSIAANMVEFAGRMYSKENYKVEMTFKCDGLASR